MTISKLIDGSALAVAGALIVTPCLAAEAKSVESQESTAQLEEVVVTAQKRSERLIDVPISITALSHDGLVERGALRFEDYQAYVPGLSSTGIAPGYNQITVRGVTTGINQLSATTSTYFDETPTNSSTSTALGNRLTPDPDLLDVARIEVLRGPQGTLYGANALGGVVRYVLAEPSLDQLRGELQAGLASTAHGELSYVGRGAIDAPIVDGKLGARLSGFYTTDSGYIDNVSTGKDNVNESKNQGGRLALLWQPTDSFTATLSSLYQKRTNEGLGSETVNNTTLRPTVGEYKQDVATREFIETQYQLHSLKLEFDLGFGSLVSATAYGSQETSLAADVSDFFGVLLGVPAVTLPFEGDVKKFTQEFRLASKAGGRFDYIVGAYYTDENAESLNGATAYLAPGVPAPPPINPLLDVDLKGDYEEFAVFANGIINFSDRFNLQIGGRWSHNEQTFSETLGGLLFGPLAGAKFTGDSSEDPTTFAISPQFKISPDAVVYARIAEGFRPGGTNLVPPGGAGVVSPTYDSDSLLNYELGFKSAALERRLDYSVAAFLVDWKDIQTTASAGGFNYLINAGKARSQGVEGELRWAVNEGLSLGANLSYTDATTRDDIASVGAKAGDPLPYVPKWAGALTADQQWTLDDGLTASLGASLRYTGSQRPYYSQATASNPAGLELDSFSLVDLRAGLRRGSYDVSLYVQNLLDEHAYLNLQTDAANPITGDGARATVARPRTVGLTFGVHF